MQQQLEQLEKDAGIEWQAFEIGELFNVGTGSLIDTQQAKKGEIPRISVQVTNNGIIGYLNEYIENARYFKNFLSVNFFGISFYHPYRASVEMKVHTLKLKDRELNHATGLFLSTTLNKKFKDVYSYGNQLSSSKLKNDGIKIQLPTINNQISYEFMEKFIATLNAERFATLNAERFATLNAYLCTTGLKDYQLTQTEQKALDELEGIEWGEFEIEDVLTWQNKINELDPLSIKSLMVSDQKLYPFYGQAIVNHGIIDYYDLQESFLNNTKSLPTILIHSNNQNTIYLDTPFYLKDGHGATSVLQSEHLNKFTAQFLMGAIQKVIFQKYSYNAKATKIELKKTEIQLPIKADHTPDYPYMETLIKAMQKVVIKNVVEHLDERIELTQNLAH